MYTLVHGQGVSLSTCAVEGNHKGGLEALAIRVLRHQVSQLSNEVPRCTQPQLDVDAFLYCLQAFFIQRSGGRT